MASAKVGAGQVERHHANVVLKKVRDFGGFRENRIMKVRNLPISHFGCPLKNIFRMEG